MKAFTTNTILTGVTHQDITAPHLVEVVVRDDAKVLWVNIDGVCVLRCCQIGTLVVNDKVGDFLKEQTS